MWGGIVWHAISKAFPAVFAQATHVGNEMCLYRSEMRHIFWAFSAFGMGKNVDASGEDLHVACLWNLHFFETKWAMDINNISARIVSWFITKKIFLKLS